MASKRKRMTAADYTALAFCPAMIVLMLTALVHFLVLCIYRGEFSTRLTYILFMFIVGATGIARITVEFGRAHASAYAAVLGLATVLVLSQFSNPLFAVSMVVIVWLLADQITFDCTVIDDNERASGEGLLNVGGWLPGTGAAKSPDVDVNLDGTTVASDDATEKDSRAKQTRRRGPRKPGRTVFWLALAALPLFGIGQWVLPDQSDIHRRAHLALGVYLFATLMLLVTTSFLNLRAYLRRRGAEMPSNVSVTWIVAGIVLTLLLLVVCFLLPVPGRAIAALQLPETLESPDWLEPSRWGWGSEGVTSQGNQDAAPGPVDSERADENARTGEADDESSEQGGRPGEGGKPGEGGQGSESGQSGQGDQQGDSGQSGDSDQQGESGEQGDSGQQGESGQQGDGGESGDRGQQGDSSQQGENAQQGENGQQGEQSPSEQEGGDTAADGSQPPDASSGSSSPPLDLTAWLPNLSSILKALIVIVLLGIVIWFLIKNRDALVAWWRSFCDYWKNLQRQAGVADDQPLDPLAEIRYREFASFRDPSGEGGDPRRVIVITFAALEAWSREAGTARHADETPSEFSRRLGGQYPQQQAALQRLAAAYNRVVYGRRQAGELDLQASQNLWQWMREGGRGKGEGGSLKFERDKTEGT
ncbi:DUF4129 domain-containing protein [Roseimaritima ulvae]|uniref:Prolipoprotein diacylglyceryl transferase n=1 Tax=Roseimaritima ulvae TaxID=980254 RepID=A0A5B9QIS7_9BACT|nr:DUF4129 domain-containing protein [Roseimaritima ulvae]QEG39017.1 prolipoprotein diacylglyceryl transferase [Roseimaritima ulvae]